MNSMHLICTFSLLILLWLTAQELGHFIFAKIFEVTVYEVSIGIGPEIFSGNHKGTICSLRLLLSTAYLSLSSSHRNPRCKEMLNDIESENKVDSDLLKPSNVEHFK